MTLANIPLHEITGDNLRSLCRNGITESQRIEFKREKYPDSREGKREFTKDVSAFANTFGGDLIIGIEEDDQGNAVDIVPVQIENLDSNISGWLNFLRDCIQPRIVGLDIHPVAVDGGYVVVIRVPKSFNPPHRANGGGSSRYYLRNPRGAHEASVEELRSVFSQGNMILEKVRSFHAERTALISENSGIYPFDEVGGRLVIHLQPLSAYGEHVALIPADILNCEQYYRPLGRDLTGSSPRINIDGAAIYSAGRTGQIGYCQVYRDGRVEYARNQIWGLERVAFNRFCIEPP